MSSSPPTIDALAAALAAVLDVPRALAGLRAEVAALRAEIERLRNGMAPPLVSVEEAARRLGVSVPTVRRSVRDGSLPSRRVGRRILVDLARPTDTEIIRLADEARGSH